MATAAVRNTSPAQQQCLVSGFWGQGCPPARGEGGGGRRGGQLQGKAALQSKSTWCEDVSEKGVRQRCVFVGRGDGGRGRGGGRGDW